MLSPDDLLAGIIALQREINYKSFHEDIRKLTLLKDIRQRYLAELKRMREQNE